MKSHVSVFTVALLAMVTGTASGGQHEGHQGASAAQSAARVTQCVQVQPVVTSLVEAAEKRLEDARLTNSPAALRDAADDVQSMLVDVRAQLAACAQMPVTAAGPPVGPVMPVAPLEGSTSRGPRSAAPAVAPGATDPHAGHAPAPPVAAPRPTPSTQATPRATQRPAAPAAGDAHAGHTQPLTPARPVAPAGRSTPPVVTSAPGAPASGSAAAKAPGTRPGPPTSIADLKCSTSLDPKTTPRMLYQGRMYYFCTDQDRAEFAKDPAKYSTAPPAQSAPTHAH